MYESQPNVVPNLNCHPIISSISETSPVAQFRQLTRRRRRDVVLLQHVDGVGPPVRTLLDAAVSQQEVVLGEVRQVAPAGLPASLRFVVLYLRRERGKTGDDDESIAIHVTNFVAYTQLNVTKL